ncbi:GATA transcription factor 26-like [Trifolium medium]|uniref:GATA transcription factor 26-like n=1 Tax=Trifolium medium TaxID=97028 RepID=A0A392QLJ4_9FABA|nr:GATA transcription factor 26-like [Trifolium medium]
MLKSEIPSKKRSLRVVRKMTPMQKFHAQLLNELKHQEIKDESSSEEVLLFDNVNNFIPPNEIGLGAVLLKPDGTSI